MAQVLSGVSATLSDAVYLTLKAHPEDDCRLERTGGAEWLHLLHQFPTVQTLHVSQELAGEVALALENVAAEMVTEVLPCLNSICLVGQPTSSVEQFVAARRRSGRPVTVQISVPIDLTHVHPGHRSANIAFAAGSYPPRAPPNSSLRCGQIAPEPNRKPKKIRVNLPKETVFSGNGQLPTRSSFARTPILPHVFPPQPPVPPPDVTSADIYPPNSLRVEIPYTIDVFLPKRSAWDAVKKKFIDEKFEELGVEKGTGSSMLHIHAPRARAASISSPADPALLFFKLNKLQQAQNSQSHTASVSPSDESGDEVAVTSVKFPQESLASKSAPPPPVLLQGPLNVAERPFTPSGLDSIDVGAIEEAAQQVESPDSDGERDGDVDEHVDGDIEDNADYEDELPIPLSMKVRCVPIPLDFKRPVSTNTAPADLFQANGSGGSNCNSNNPSIAGEGKEERTRRTVKSRIDTREIIEDASRLSFGALHSPTISHKESRDRLSVKSGACSPFSDASVHPQDIPRGLELQQYEERLEALLESKLGDFRKEVSALRAESLSTSQALQDKTSELLVLQRDVLSRLIRIPDNLAASIKAVQPEDVDLLAHAATKDFKEVQGIIATHSDLRKPVKVRAQHGPARAEKSISLERIASERDQLRAKVDEIQAVMLPRAAEAVTSRTMALEEASSQSLAWLKTLDVTIESQQERLIKLEKLNRESKADEQPPVSKVHSQETQAGFASRDKDAAIEALAALRKESDALVLQQSQWDELRRTDERLEQLAALVSQAQTNEREMRELRRVRERSKVLEGEYAALQRRYKEQGTRVESSDRALNTARASLAQAQQRAAEWEQRANENEAALEEAQAVREQAKDRAAQLEAEHVLMRMQLDAEERLAKDRESKLRDQVVALEAQLLAADAERLDTCATQ